MRRGSIHLFVVVVGVACAALPTGCGCQRTPAPAPVPATPTEKPAPERSKFFAQMVGEVDAGGLKARFEKKFPGLAFHVGRAGPVTMRPVDGGPAKAQVEVQLVVKDVKAKFAEDLPKILAELEAYLKESLTAAGMELNGPVHEKTKDGKKIGFWFGYKSATHSGSLTVDPQAAVIGSNLITVAEDE